MMLTYYIYRLITTLIRPFIYIYILIRISKGKEDKSRVTERYGISGIERKDGKVIWFHAASIGECLSVLPILRKLNSDKSIVQIVLTTGTVTSANILQDKLSKKIIHQYIPFDIPSYINKFLNHWNPSQAVFLESEIWPNFLTELNKRNICSLIVNGRMTIKSFKRWSILSGSSKKIFSYFTACCTQNSDSAFFYEKLGIKNTINTGNLKFAYKPDEIFSDELKILKSLTKKRKIFLAASTHSGEEEIIKNITLNLKKTEKKLLTIIVPRHVTRKSFFSSSKGLGLSIRSKNQKIKDRTYLYLADTIGELNMFYSLANIVFIGGSLVPHGGQNPIEAAYLGKKIYHGKNIENFIDVYDILKQLKFTQQVENARQLEHYVKEALANPKSVNKDININRLKKEGDNTVSKVMEVIYKHL